MINLTERHQHILRLLQQAGSVQVLNLCEELNVSSVTIRKDLKLLEDKGLLFRTHGGATQHNPYTVERSVNEKESIQAGEKNRIAVAAAQLIAPNDSIMIASGTTVLALAKNIKPNNNLTVITSALPVALELIRQPATEVMQLGGLLRRNSSSVTGPYAETTLADFSCSKLFLGVDGIDLEFGLTTTHVLEAHLNRQMIKVCQRTIVLADSTKFNKRGFGRICGFEDIDQIITDKGISGHIAHALESMGVTVTVV